MRGTSLGRERRQALIMEILDSQEIVSQQDLLEALAAKDVKVNQSSVSRDLQEMGVIKVRGRYVINAAAAPETAQDLKEIIGMVKSFHPAGSNLLILHTPQGIAPGVGVALDKVGWQEILGTISGDDTLFVATASRREQIVVEQRLSDLTGMPSRPSARTDISISEVIGRSTSGTKISPAKN